MLKQRNGEKSNIPIRTSQGRKVSVSPTDGGGDKYTALRCGPTAVEVFAPLVLNVKKLFARICVPF